MDPITTIIVAALGKLNENLIRDAYDKLKATIAKKFGSANDLASAVKSLEEKPSSIGRQQTLSEEIVSAKIAQDIDVFKATNSLRNELMKFGLQPSSFVTQRAGDKSVQVGGSVSGSSIAITDGIDEREFNIALSKEYNDKGLKDVRLWGERMYRSQGNDWDWYLLDHAIEYYVDSIKYDPQNQEPWINLAYMCHLLGNKHKAMESLDKALAIVESSTSVLSGRYERVKIAIHTDSYLSGGQVARPIKPDWFCLKNQKLLS